MKDLRYNYSLNTRKGFKVIYYLMRLTGFSFARTLIDIIRVRHDDIDDFIKNVNILRQASLFVGGGYCRNIEKLHKECLYITNYLIDVGYKYPT